MRVTKQEYKPSQFYRQKTEWLFPVPLWEFGLSDCGDINKNIEKRVYEKSKQEETVGYNLMSNEGGWHSEWRMQEDPVMEPIIKFIAWGVKELSVESRMVYKEFQISLWSNLNYPGDYNTTHDHPDCHMSGVYYVKLPKGDCGKTRFYNPMYSYNYNSDEYNPPYTQPRVEVSGKEGTLLICRAPILHDVSRNNTKEDRISLAFNIRFMG